jgi:MFS family permease
MTSSPPVMSGRAPLGNASLAPLGRALEAATLPRLPGLGRNASALAYAWFLWGLGAGLWAYTWPVYLASLGADSVQVGSVIGVGSLIATLVYLPGGFVAQLGNHKLQMVALHGLHTLATGSFALAGEWWHVVPGVLLQNFVAILAPAVNGYLTRVADEERVGVARLYSVIGSAQFIAMTASPPAGGWVSREFGEHAVFPLALLGCGLSVLAMAMCRSFALPSPVGAEPTSSPVRTSRGGGAVGAGWASYRDLLASGSVRLLLVTSLVVNVAIHVAIQFSAIYLRDHFAYDTAGIGWTGAAASAGSAVIVLVIERIRRRWGLRPAMVASCALSGVHFLATLASPALWVQALSHFCRGGIPAIGTLVTVAVTDRSERANVASAVALIATTGNIAAFVMPPLGGWMYASIPAAPFLAGAGALAIAQGLVWITFRPTPRREAGATLDGSGLP